MTPTPTTISRALAEYLTDWLAWVDRGAPDGEPYDRAAGLCYNAPNIQVHMDLWGVLDGDLYPFGGAEQFNNDLHDRTQHLNEARLSWVRRTILTAEIEG